METYEKALIETLRSAYWALYDLKMDWPYRETEADEVLSEAELLLPDLIDERVERERERSGGED